jgi:PHD/YefM family antitoxin component YafN of YafNO toxin-antitoxin module
VRLLNRVEAEGVALEVTRRQRKSVILVRAVDFEQRLGRSHPWSSLRARISPHSFHPNGLKPGVTHRWTFASSTWIRDHFCSVMEWVDAANQPLLVTRRGKCGLMLLAQLLFETHWTTSPQADEPGAEFGAGKNLAKDPVLNRVTTTGTGLNLAHQPLHPQALRTSTETR